MPDKLDGAVISVAHAMRLMRHGWRLLADEEILDGHPYWLLDGLDDEARVSRWDCEQAKLRPADVL